MPAKVLQQYSIKAKILVLFILILIIAVASLFVNIFVIGGQFGNGIKSDAIKSETGTVPHEMKLTSSVPISIKSPHILKVFPGPLFSVHWEWPDESIHDTFGPVGVRLEMQETPLGKHYSDEGFKVVTQNYVRAYTQYTPASLKPDTAYHFRLSFINSVGAAVSPLSDVTTTTTVRLGVMTVMLDEEATIAFVVRSLIHQVDKYVVVDTGSVDASVKVLQCLFPSEIASKQLEIIQFGSVTSDNPISEARNVALDALRQAKCSYFLKADAEDVWYEYGGRIVHEEVDVLAHSKPDVTTCELSFRELYQNVAQDTLSFLSQIINGTLFFEYQTDHPPQTHRIQRVQGAKATGSWSDEWDGARPEGVYYDDGVHTVSRAEIVGAHYGWARPVNRKRDKIKIMSRNEDTDPGELDKRVDRLHEDTNHILKPFHEHPEAVLVYVSRVYDTIQSGECR